MDSRSRTLRRISKTTSTSCGIGLHRAATFRRRGDGWTYRRTMGEPGRWGYPRSPTASPRWWSKEPWSRSWNHLSTTIHTGIDPANRRSMQSAWRGSAAGATMGARPGHPLLFRGNRQGFVDAGGAQAYGLPVGAALPRQMVESAGPDAGWQPHQQGERNTARRGRQSPAGQPLSSLLVRQVDATEPPEHPLRAL